MSGMKKPKRKQKKISLDKKLKIIRAHATITSTTELGRMFKLAPSTINTIIKNKDKILKAMKGGTQLDRACITTGKHKDLEEILLVLYTNRDIGSFTGTDIKNDAFYLATELNIDGFEANNGWLGNFKNRNPSLFNPICKNASLNLTIDEPQLDVVVEIESEKVEHPVIGLFGDNELEIPVEQLGKFMQDINSSELDGNFPVDLEGIDFTASYGLSWFKTLNPNPNLTHNNDSYSIAESVGCEYHATYSSSFSCTCQNCIYYYYGH